MNVFKGKTALVTGGSRGIGRAVCVRLASDGADIVLHYHRNRAAAEETASTLAGAVRIVQANLSNAAEIGSMFEQLNGISLDFLVNNAGIWKGTPLGATSAEEVDEMLNTNVKGPFLVTQSALGLLKDGARIVNISSVAGRIGIAGGRSVYGASKAAIDSFTRNWALELAPRGILVNSVAPGYVETDMTAAHLSDPSTRQRALVRHPLGALGTPGEVADVVAFLCSEDARFITGQSLNVSGGFVI